MIRDILNGISAYSEAWKMAREYKLWKYFLIPSLISLTLGIAIFTSAYYTGSYFFGKIDLWLQSDFFTRFAILEKILQYLGSFLSGILIVIPTLFIFKYLVIIVNGPFMAPLSEKVEKIIYGELPSTSGTGISRLGYSIVRGLKFNIALIFREIILTLIISIISLPLGVITPFLLFIIQAYYAGRGNMDYAMERYFDHSESLRFSKMQRGTAIGNGIPFILLLYIPILGFILAPPLSTIAVTKETLEKIKSAENH